ncbi:MAG TPA: hypothetical protein VGX48_17690 [Pyrinomonadaceae bacterium]|jgi:hypothetical protein|nr:hypothetical protein [Pyrinomonadaceae bacterium]
MINSQETRTVVITPPQGPVDNAAFVTATLDTLGAGYVDFIVVLGSIDAALAALKVRESDASDMTGAADVPGADFSVAPSALPGATDDNKAYHIGLDMRGRKRYLDLVLTAGDGAAGTFACVIAQLSRLASSPRTAAQRGFAGELLVPTL